MKTNWKKGSWLGLWMARWKVDCAHREHPVLLPCMPASVLSYHPVFFVNVFCFWYSFKHSDIFLRILVLMVLMCISCMCFIFCVSGILMCLAKQDEWVGLQPVCSIRVGVATQTAVDWKVCAWLGPSLTLLVTNGCQIMHAWLMSCSFMHLIFCVDCEGFPRCKRRFSGLSGKETTKIVLLVFCLILKVWLFVLFLNWYG